jgi:hypothetical protein
MALVLVSLLGLSAVALSEGRGGGGAAGDAASMPFGHVAEVGPGRYCYWSDTAIGPPIIGCHVTQ